MFVVGLTGGIGSGKSTVAELFVAQGAGLIDTDAIAHELTAPAGAAMPAVQAAFGDSVMRLDGALDRDAMRARVFNDPAARRRLEGILHPLIREETGRRLRAVNAPYTILAVPLLLESGFCRECCDRILVVDCSEATQVRRVMARSGLAETEVRAIMVAQASRTERLAIADDVIDNDGGIEDLQGQIMRLHQKYRQMAGLTEVKADC